MKGQRLSSLKFKLLNFRTFEFKCGDITDRTLCYSAIKIFLSLPQIVYDRVLIYVWIDYSLNCKTIINCMAMILSKYCGNKCNKAATVC